MLINSTPLAPVPETDAGSNLLQAGAEKMGD
jgi:hypothetical protein